MKRIALLFLAFIAGMNAYATHNTGFNLRVEHTGNGNLYRIFVTDIQNCELGGGVPNSMQIIVSIKGCGFNYLDTLQQVSVWDTVEKFCPGNVSSCGNLSSPLLGYYSRILTDTITLPACSALKIEISGLYTNATTNIANSSSGGPDYSGVFINTQSPATVNSSPILPNNFPLIVYSGGLNDLPFPLVDPDNDSLVVTSVEPRYDSGSIIPYAAGFNLSAPFGTGSYMTYNAATKSWNILTNMMGKFSVCIRIDEYRNGQKIAGSLRNYEMTALSATSIPTYPAPTTPISYNTCPGQPNNIQLAFQDPTSTDSVFLTVTSPVVPGFTFTTTTASGPSTATANLSWVTPATANPATLPHFYFDVTAWDNNCPRRSLARYSVMVRVRQCNTDTVWAGDANADFTANVYDPLAVAVAFNKTGPARPNATILWQPEYCANWTDTFANGVNFKHADCNGDGLVDNNDLAAISANWGSVHMKESPKAKTSGVPDLYFDISGISFTPGTAVSVPIKLGSASAPMNNIYGIAGNISIGGISLVGAPAVTYNSSWLGNSSNTLNFSKMSGNVNSIDWALARTNQQNVSGSGTIGTLNFSIPSGITSTTPVTLSFNGTKMVNNRLAELPGNSFNALDTTALIVPVGISSLSSAISYAMVVPNPSAKEAALHLMLKQTASVTLTITDVAGRVLSSETTMVGKGAQQIQLPSVAPGMYMIRVSCGSESRAVKWIRN